MTPKDYIATATDRLLQFYDTGDSLVFREFVAWVALLTTDGEKQLASKTETITPPTGLRHVLAGRDSAAKIFLWQQVIIQCKLKEVSVEHFLLDLDTELSRLHTGMSHDS